MFQSARVGAQRFQPPDTVRVGRRRAQSEPEWPLITQITSINYPKFQGARVDGSKL